MPIKVTCSQCGGVLHAPDDSSGKRGRCPTCGTVLTIIGEFVGPGGVSSPQFGAPPGPQSSFGRPAAQAPVANPWGSLPGGPEEPPSQPISSVAPAPAPRASYDLAKEPPPSRPASAYPGPSEAIPDTRGSRVPPDPRKYTVQDPFAKPGKTNDATAETNGQWIKAYRGLGWVRTGIVLCVLAVLAYGAVPILLAFNVQVPNQSPGYLKIADYTQAEEIRLFATVGLSLLAFLCLLVGRLGVSRAPAAAYANAPSKFAALATLIAFAGFVAVAVTVGLGMKDAGFIPQFTPEPGKLTDRATLFDKLSRWAEGVFLPANEMAGQVQGYGVAALVGFGLLAEVWFVAALGRMAASLRHGPAAGRVNRFVILMGLLFAIKVGLILAARVYHKAWYEETIWSKWEHLEAKWRTVGPLACLAVIALVFALLYWRMVGGVREAIRENVDVNA